MGVPNYYPKIITITSSIGITTVTNWEGPGRLQSMGLQRVGHDWVTEQQQRIHILSVAVYKYMHEC